MKSYLLKTVLIFITPLIASFNSKAQTPILDSLKSVAEKAGNDTTKANAYNAIAWNLIEDDPEISIQNGMRGLQLAQKARNKFIEADCYKSIGVAYDYKGDLDSCIFFLNQSLSLYTKLNNTVKQSNVFSDIALAYFARGIYELALKNHFLSLELRKKTGDKLLVGKAYNNIGLVYKGRKDYTKAIQYYNNSLWVKKELNDERGELNTILNIGSLYQNSGQYDSALLYAHQALQLAIRLKITADIAASNANIANALLVSNKSLEAESFVQKAEQQAIESNCKICFYTIYHIYGNIFLQRKNYAKALEYFNKGLSVSESNKRQETMMNFYTNISNTYQQSGQYKLALAYRDSAQKIDSVLLNKENLRQINEMSAVYESAEKEKEIARLNINAQLSADEAEERSKQLNYFIIASILFLGLAALAFRAFQSNKKKKEQLGIQNRIIEKSLSEKEVLMKEIHHRVKNNLQVVSSLLNLQSNYIKDEQAQDAVRDSRNRVQSMALIHQNLYQEENLTGIQIREYIGTLCDSLFSSYNISPNKIKLIKDIQPLMLDVDTVIPLGLIFNELISNSLKYAFQKNGKEGIIKIGVREEKGLLRLFVYDNGSGFPDDFKHTHTQSFGHKMINAFLQKMEGTINMYNEDGAKVDIEIKNYKSKQA